MRQRRRVATKLAHSSVALVPYLRDPRNPRSNPAGREQEGREERAERKVGFRSATPDLPVHLCRKVWRDAAESNVEGRARGGSYFHTGIGFGMTFSGETPLPLWQTTTGRSVRIRPRAAIGIALRACSAGN